MNYTHRLFILLLLVLTSCKARFVATSHNNQSIPVTSIASDSLTDIERYLIPYRDSLSGIMNEVIGNATGDFKKEKPAGSLGNLTTDAILWKAIQLNLKLDSSAVQSGNKSIFAIVNYGGIRINQISKGNITIGKIFELLPFENELVIVEVKGSTLMQWCNLIAKSGGWPIAGFKFDISQDKAIQLQGIANNNSSMQTINDPVAPPKLFSIEEHETYWIATNDYIANGGDNCEFLKECKQTKTGILIRDVMIDYVKKMSRITPDTKNRITIIKE